MLATSLVAASSAIVFLLGVVHFLYTFRGRKLCPRDPDLEARLKVFSPVIAAVEYAGIRNRFMRETRASQTCPTATDSDWTTFMCRAISAIFALLLAGCAAQPPSPQDLQAKRFETIPDRSVGRERGSGARGRLSGGVPGCPLIAAPFS